MNRELVVPEQAWWTVLFKNDTRYKGLDQYLCGSGMGKYTNKVWESKRLTKNSVHDWWVGLKPIPSCVEGVAIQVTIPAHVVVVEQ